VPIECTALGQRQDFQQPGPNWIDEARLLELLRFTFDPTTDQSNQSCSPEARKGLSRSVIASSPLTRLTSCTRLTASTEPGAGRKACAKMERATLSRSTL